MICFNPPQSRLGEIIFFSDLKTKGHILREALGVRCKVIAPHP